MSHDMSHDEDEEILHNIDSLILALEVLRPEVSQLDRVQWTKLRIEVNHLNYDIKLTLFEVGRLSHIGIHEWDRPTRHLTLWQRLTGKITSQGSKTVRAKALS